MKKIILLIFVVAGMSITFTSCQEEVKMTTGTVKEVNDNQMVMMVGEYEIKVDISKSKFSKGPVIAMDSINVAYLGELKSKSVKAMDVIFIPKSMWIENRFDPNKELIVGSVDTTRSRKLKEFVENAGSN